MAGDLIPFEVPAALQSKMKEIFGEIKNDLAAGVGSSFAVVSFKGKVWRVKYQGESTIVKNKDGDPASSLFAVIVKGSPDISKIYYKGSYTEGDDNPPDCFSIDGKKPDPSVSTPQHSNCAACPKAVFGSKITENGTKAKACSDSRRMAVVPYPDIENKSHGGPLMLRVPPASLQPLKQYAEWLEARGLPYQAVVTKITFDAEMAYPKLMFSAVKALDEEEAHRIIEVMKSDVVERMLSEGPVSEATEQESDKPKDAGPKPAEEPAPKKAPVEEEIPEKVAAPEEEKPKAKPSAKEANAVEGSGVSEELDNMLGSLLS